MYNSLISLSLEKAEAVLKERGEKYIIKHIKTFKLSRPDTAAVVNVKTESGITVLYVCNFMCGICNGEQDV